MSRLCCIMMFRKVNKSQQCKSVEIDAFNIKKSMTILYFAIFFFAAFLLMD